MKLHFEPNLDYQHTAIESVCDLFRGQETCRTEFTVTRDALAAQQTLAFAQSDLGIGNRLQLLDDELLANLGDIQIRNGLRPSASLASGDFTVEMETGTGKTYVYLRTIFELNRRYGFTKFVIVVPSVAIKEGVTRRSRSPKSTSAPSTPTRPSSTSFTTPASSARCATSPPARTSRSWW